MTYEKLERANELAEEMSNLLEIQQMMSPRDECGQLTCDQISMCRHRYNAIPIAIPADICDKIVALISDEREKLRKEFEAL